MKVTVIGSHLCPDTLYALNKRVIFHVGSNDFSNRLKGSKSPAACRKHGFDRQEGSGPRWGRSLVRFYRSLRHRSSRDSRRTAT